MTTARTLFPEHEAGSCQLLRIEPFGASGPRM